MTQRASWTCTACDARNGADEDRCKVCDTPRAGGTDDVMSQLGQADVLRGGPIAAPTGVPSLGPDRRGRAPAPGGDARRSVADAGGVTMELPVVDAAPAPGPAAAGTPAPARRIPPNVARALPLALVASVGAGVLTALFAAGFRDAASAEVEADAGPPGPDHVVDLPAVDAIIGLTDDNKEAVITLCWRVSSNTGHECRLSYLRDIGEYPHRVVPFGPLRVDGWEVSNARYDACVEAGDCTPRDMDACRFYSIYRYELGQPVPEAMRHPGHPANCVTADQARAFCASRGMRLPTTEEWERIARSGDDRMQPWGRFWTPAILNWGERDMVGFPIPGRLDGAELTAAVDDYEDGRTDEDVYNLFGNVAEWVEPMPDDPAGYAGVRGGGYTDDTLGLRITRHLSRPADQPRSDVGFRCVASGHASATPEQSP